MDGLWRLKQTAEGAQCPHVLLRLCQASGEEEEDGGMGWWCRRGGGRGRGHENRTEAPGLFSFQIVGDLEHCLFKCWGFWWEVQAPTGSPVGKEGLPSLRAESWAPDCARATGLLLLSGDTGKGGVRVKALFMDLGVHVLHLEAAVAAPSLPLQGVGELSLSPPPGPMASFIFPEKPCLLLSPFYMFFKTTSLKTFLAM